MNDSIPKYSVQISQVEGLTIGEHQVIMQYFADSAHARLSHYFTDFAWLIAEKTTGFVGRQFVFDALDKFMETHKSGYFVVEGLPGVGKTSLAAHLVKTRGYPCHFNVASMNIRAPHKFLGNASAQLVARYGLPYQMLPQDALDDSRFLVRCLEQAAAKAENRPVVLAVDALDEADRPLLAREVNDLYLPRDLPEGAFIFVTTRPSSSMRLSVAHVQRFNLAKNSPENQQDVRLYIGTQLSADQRLRDRMNAWGMSEEPFVNVLAHRSEGNFMYLHYVLPAIADGVFQSGHVEELPQGLIDYYGNHWDRMQVVDRREFEQIYEPIVCLLAVVAEPVSIDKLHDWTGQDRRRIRHAIEQWRPFLDELPAGQEKLYRIYHASFQEFLETKVDLVLYDELIVRYALDQLDALEREA